VIHHSILKGSQIIVMTKLDLQSSLTVVVSFYTELALVEQSWLVDLKVVVALISNLLQSYFGFLPFHTSHFPSELLNTHIGGAEDTVCVKTMCCTNFFVIIPSIYQLTNKLL
jgi:hypothetical protein